MMSTFYLESHSTPAGHDDDEPRVDNATESPAKVILTIAK